MKTPKLWVVGWMLTGERRSEVRRGMAPSATIRARFSGEAERLRMHITA